MSVKFERAVAYVLLWVMLASLLPVMYIGRYNHPTGDDYYYGADTRAVWESTGNIFETMAEAARGTAYQYLHWQGTYSAMFLMHLPPNLFGAWAYRFVTFIILTALAGGIFYFMNPLICSGLGGSKELWLTVSSLLTLLCVQTVPSQGEAFFWYNGSMYYTGYFAASLFFFGLLLRYVTKPRRYQLAVMGILAVFLAGGNYVTLLPTVLIVMMATGGLLYKDLPAGRKLGIVAGLMLIGFGVNIAAPGNRVRQAGMWGIPAWKAILKSLLQGINYLRAWTTVWVILMLIIITPFLWKAFMGCKFRFQYPVLAIGLAYGLFCSMSCPVFYTMNSTGPARVVAVVYYGFIFTVLFCYSYLLGYICRIRREKTSVSLLAEKAAKGNPLIYKGIVMAFCVFLLAGQAVSGAVGVSASGKAVKLLVTGEAAAYEQEYLLRMQILEDKTVMDVVFQPYINQPDMLYVGDFDGDPQHETNQKAAQYFHKDSICVAY